MAIDGAKLIGARHDEEVKIAFDDATNLVGKGFNIMSNKLVEATPFANPPQPQPHFTSQSAGNLKYEFISNRQNLDRLKKKMLSLEGGYSGFSAGGALNYMSEYKESDTSMIVFILYSYSSIYTKTLNFPAGQNPFAADVLAGLNNNEITEQFIATYGTHYISRVRYGAVFVGRAIIKTQSSEVKKTLEAELKGGVSSLAHVNAAIQNVMYTSETQISVGIDYTTFGVPSFSKSASLFGNNNDCFKQLDDGLNAFMKTVERACRKFDPEVPNKAVHDTLLTSVVSVTCIPWSKNNFLAYNISPNENDTQNEFSTACNNKEFKRAADCLLILNPNGRKEVINNLVAQPGNAVIRLAYAYYHLENQNKPRIEIVFGNDIANLIVYSSEMNEGQPGLFRISCLRGEGRGKKTLYCNRNPQNKKAKYLTAKLNASADKSICYIEIGNQGEYFRFFYPKGSDGNYGRYVYRTTKDELDLKLRPNPPLLQSKFILNAERKMDAQNQPIEGSYLFNIFDPICGKKMYLSRDKARTLGVKKGKGRRLQARPDDNTTPDKTRFLFEISQIK